jgi:hypothetical protein
MESLQVFKGVVLAIDGWVMSTRKPTMKEVENVMSYRNKNAVWGIVSYVERNEYWINK